MQINSLFFCFILLLNSSAFSQTTVNEFYFLFYNTENLFDPLDDSQTEDDEFTPQGARRWTWNRFNRKLTAISKVILNASGWTPPHLIALCEVENLYVLDKLLKNTPLQAFPYQIIHKDSPDPRGIDVALIYNSDVFYPLEYRYIPVKVHDGTILKSREMLYVFGILNNADTLHIFANHWPSRYSGLLESQPARNLAARNLHTCITEIQDKHLNPKILIAGDFNDQPSNESLSTYLNAKEVKEYPEKNKIYNLSLPWSNNEIKTLKHQSQWSVFDQILVSGSLMESGSKLFTKSDWAQIITLPFLLEKDEKFGGLRLNRTYIGYRYHGGFSDHLPVLLKIRTNL